jgi:hypothetical protein
VDDDEADARMLSPEPFSQVLFIVEPQFGRMSDKHRQLTRRGSQRTASAVRASCLICVEYHEVVAR